MKSAIKRNFIKFTGILGFKNRNNNDQNQTGVSNTILSPPPSNVDTVVVSLERDEFDKRVAEFRVYLSQVCKTSIHLPSDLLQCIFISTLSNTNMLIDTSQINNNNKYNNQQTNCSILSNVIPIMNGQSCSFITCTRTTTPEDLVSKLFINHPVTLVHSPISSDHHSSPNLSNSRFTSLNNSVSGGVGGGGLTGLNNSSTTLPMVDILLVDDIDLAPLPTRYTLFQMMTYRKVAYKGKTYDTPTFFSVIATVSSFNNEFNVNPNIIDDDNNNNNNRPKIEPLSPLILDNFFINYRLYESLSVPPVIPIENDPLLLPQASTQILTTSRLTGLRNQLQTDHIYITNDLEQYIRTIIVNLRNHPLVTYGPSPRATPTLTIASKATALLAGQKFVTPTHVISAATLVLNHRIFLSNPFPENTTTSIENYNHHNHHHHHNNNHNHQGGQSYNISPSTSPDPQSYLKADSSTTKESTGINQFDQLPTIMKSTSKPKLSILSQATHLPPPPISIVDTSTTNTTTNNSINDLHQSTTSINSSNNGIIDSFSVIKIMLANLPPPL